MENKIGVLREAYRRGILPADMIAGYKEAVKRGLIQDDTLPGPDTVTSVTETPTSPEGPGVLGSAGKTLQDVSKVYPAAETAANLLTSAYGLPASGLAGLAALPFGLDKANEVVEEVQKYMIYEPQTDAGTDLLKATMFPVEKLETEIAEPVGARVAEAGYPNLGAGVKTGILAAPIIAAGGKVVLKPSTKRASKQISKRVTKDIEKGIRPGIEGRRRYSQGVAYEKQAESAVRYIIENKNDLKLTGPNGETIAGKLPQNLKQFSQAIEQSQRKVFHEYDRIARTAGKKGATVDLTPIVDKLLEVVEHKAVRDINPELAKYAEGLAERLMEREIYTTIEAQDAIATLNNSLEAFYKNPTYENASKSYVDSMLANNLRKALDGVIEETTGTQYQTLKNQYGALKTIEKDVYRRSLVDARKTTKGLLDFTDVFSGFHVVHGILNLNPTVVSAGVSAKGIAMLYRLRNNPNRIVKKMFQETEKMINKETAGRIRKGESS